MSDTPRTDAALERIPVSGHYSAAIREIVPAEFARQLERENEKLKEAAVDLDVHFEATATADGMVIESLKAENARLREVLKWINLSSSESQIEAKAKEELK